MIKNYFVPSSTEPHTWAWGKQDDVTGFSSHARINVPVDTSNIGDFGAALRQHPQVVRVEKMEDKVQGNHQSPFNWKVTIYATAELLFLDGGEFTRKILQREVQLDGRSLAI